MADTVTSQTLVDGEKNVVMKFTNFSDGTGEVAVLKVDVSGLSGSPASVKITRVKYFIGGMSVRILWDATSDVDAIILNEGQGEIDFKNFGGIQNNAGAGVTGDINFTTAGASVNDSYTIILEMQKS